jgi:hypothetical protein
MKTKIVEIDVKFKLEVPEETEFVAFDEDGEICVSQKGLKKGGECSLNLGYWYGIGDKDQSIRNLSKIKNWKQTLRKVNKVEN